MAQSTRELNVNINVDITETIRGLKAIQREAKKAAQALRELESAVEYSGGFVTAGEGGHIAVLHRNEYVIPRKEAAELTYEQRLEAAGAIDLRDNHRIIDLGNGYARIEPIDPTKLWKAKEVSE